MIHNVTAGVDDPKRRPLIWQNASNAPRKRLVVVCAHTLMRAALAELFRVHFDEMDFVEAPNSSDAVLRLNEAEDGWLIVHQCADFPTNLEWLQSNFVAAPWRVVILCGDTATSPARRWIELGAQGVLTDRLNATEFVSAMRSIFSGQKIVKVEAAGDRNSAEMEKLLNAIDRLKPRSRTILNLLCDGRSTRDIAAALGISQRTVKWHLTTLLSELNLHSRFRVVAIVTRIRCSIQN
jgi:RNA polymerase sigma factor (sigma-70 family)